MSKHPPTVCIVDDDAAVCDSLKLLLKTVGIHAETYPTANSFLEAYDPDRPGCLVLDLRMPGMSGLELQARLAEMKSLLPIIFVTGHGSVDSAVHAMRAGAVNFLQKPFDDQALLETIQYTLARDRRNREKLAQTLELLQRVQSLTPREREVMGRVVQGEANKVIALELDVSERTVEIHRSRMMRKMGAESLPELVRIALVTGVTAPETA